MIEKYFFLVLFIIAITVVLLGIANGRDCFEELIICCPLIFNIMILSSAYSNITESMAQVISMVQPEEKALSQCRCFSI